MKKINQDFATHLYRIFCYEKGKNRKHDLSVRAFQDFLYKEGIEYSIRALYDYAEGRIPFPAGLIPHLIRFSRDEKLVSMFLPAIKDVVNELHMQMEDEEKQLREKMELISRAKKDLSI